MIMLERRKWIERVQSKVLVNFLIHCCNQILDTLFKEEGLCCLPVKKGPGLSWWGRQGAWGSWSQGELEKRELMGSGAGLPTSTPSPRDRLPPARLLLPSFWHPHRRCCRLRSSHWNHEIRCKWLKESLQINYTFSISLWFCVGSPFRAFLGLVPLRLGEMGG